MGNDFCYGSVPRIEKTTARQSTEPNPLLQFNKQFTNSNKNPHFLDFHMLIVAPILRDGYLQIQPSNYKIVSGGQYPDSNEQHEIYYKIKEDLQKRVQHPFNQIVLAYFLFLKELFDLETDLDDISYNSADVRTNAILQKNKQSKHKCKSEERFSLTIVPNVQIDLCGNRSQQQLKLHRSFLKCPEMSKLILNQCQCIAQILQLIISIMYDSQLKTIFGSEGTVDYEIMINRVVQQHLLGSRSPLGMIIPQALLANYDSKSFVLSSGDISPPILNGGLLPQTLNVILSEFSPGLKDSTKFIETIIEDCPTEDLQGNSKINMIPYYQSFPLVNRIINTNKPWLKFKLIGKLDQMIVSIFMRNRTNSQYDDYNNIISAEDSKADILLYVLYRFMVAYPKYLRKSYMELRWMSDFDGILSKELKNYLCPWFLRFVSIYELALQAASKLS